MDGKSFKQVKRPPADATTSARIDNGIRTRLATDAALADGEFARRLRHLVGPHAPTTAHDGTVAAEPITPVASPSVNSRADDDFGMVGSSPPMRAVFDRIRRCAASNAPVLIAGETGTGKELAARAIHEHSPRAPGPFVVINCAALPATLISSELFGYEKGAFTGAAARKNGRLEAANRGTVFLDEIGDLPLDLQGHLLRFLQEKVIERVGGSKPITLDVRVIAASHVSLADAVRRAAFRDDLFYRLHILTISMPSLRERGEDILHLARHTLQTAEQESRSITHEFSPSAVEAIVSHDWPGNVRELIASIRRAVVFARAPLIQAADLGLVPYTARRSTPELAESRRPQIAGTRGSHANKDQVRAVLLCHGYNVKRAASDLGVSRVTMYRLIQKFGIELERPSRMTRTIGDRA